MCPILGRGVINAVRQAVRVALRYEVAGDSVIATRHRFARSGAPPPGRHNVREVLAIHSVKPAGSLAKGCQSMARAVTAEARTHLRVHGQRGFRRSGRAVGWLWNRTSAERGLRRLFKQGGLRLINSGADVTALK